jgi:hypothetical protein
MNKVLSLAMVGLVSVGISLASPAVSEAWVYAPGRQPQPQNAAPSYFNNYGNYGYYPGNFNYGFNGYGYNGYRNPGYYSGYNIYANPIFTPNGVIQPQFGFFAPYGY